MVEMPLETLCELSEEHSCENGCFIIAKLTHDDIEILDAIEPDGWCTERYIRAVVQVLKVYAKCGSVELALMLCKEEDGLLAYLEQVEEGGLSVMNDAGWGLDELLIGSSAAFATAAAA